jgi:hypothetical protein
MMLPNRPTSDAFKAMHRRAVQREAAEVTHPESNVTALACARCGAVLADPAGHVCEVDRLREEVRRLRDFLRRMPSPKGCRCFPCRMLEARDAEWCELAGLAPTPAGPR